MIFVGRLQTSRADHGQQRTGRRNGLRGRFGLALERI